MQYLRTSGLALIVVLFAAGPVRAQAEAPGSGDEDAGSGYCDYVEGVAAAESALLWSPELFGSFGYIDQFEIVNVPEETGANLRLTAGIGYSLSGLYQGFVTRQRAKADCRRHRALQAVRGDTTARALAARAQVLDQALEEAEGFLRQAQRDLDGGRTTAQEVTATRLRVDELRALAADTHAALGALPDAAPPMSRALATFYEADADVEGYDAKLRRLRAWDVGVRVGYDRFLDADDESPYFALVSARFNLGWLLQGGANERAAAGRRRMVQDEAGSQLVDATRARLAAAREAERKRKAETEILRADLEKQLRALRSVRGESGRRYQRMIWFEWVKIKAEDEYLRAHLESLDAVLGGGGEP